ncbi:hypothetical protein NDU88_008347 [Pleurodeles waltl]|uniref:Uncharacterized protein n=1 Tax=Pleurodeles waltl TaxID=8319 RepID=A0AAV7RUH2_PLEWA|nr:hypothetical protein NDU88_008347 [Pleurodeles waltl]
MEKFLPSIHQEIGSLKMDFRSSFNDLCKDVTTMRERVEVLEYTMESRTEEQEELWRQLYTLEEQHVELQIRQEDLENRDRCHNL